jgi:asparagine synthase (glutamine-hydrolysing)
MALSGGFDSRLILAGLMARGCRPGVFVYGDPGSADVRIATAIAQAEELRCEPIDKGAIDRGEPPLDAQRLEEACRFLDGLPVDGIVDRGADRYTRRLQAAGGALALNGGGGEILRNFFHLPDRGYTAAELVRAFYGGADARALRRTEDLRAVHEGMASSIARSVGASGRLSRKQVELAYPLFRCRYWMGRNNAVSSRWGRFATPLLDRWLVRVGAGLPLAWKAAGGFEAEVIASLHRGVASHPSTYGFAFTEPPGLRARWDEWSSCVRPVPLRPWIASVRRSLQGRRSAPSGLLAECRRLLGGPWGIEALVDPARLAGDGALQRAVTLEHLVRTRGVRVHD